MRGSNKAIAMIGGGIQEVPAVKQVQDMGYQCIVTDRNPRAPAFRDADYKVCMDGQRPLLLIEQLENLETESDLELCGVFTLTELFVSVSRVADWFGLTGASLQASKNCHHKILAKQRWLNRGIPTARGEEVTTEEQALELFHFFDNDAFIKPDVGFGAQGCKRVQTEDELLTQFWYIKRESSVLMEEYLEGEVHDVNAVFDKNGNFYPLSITDRHFEGTREIEASSPTSLKADECKHLYGLMEDAAHALGIDKGPIKADVMVTDSEYYFMEMATRLHGPLGTLHLIPESLGFRPLDAMLYAITGQEIPEECMRQHHQKPKVARRLHTAEIVVT